MSNLKNTIAEARVFLAQCENERMEEEVENMSADGRKLGRTIRQYEDFKRKASRIKDSRTKQKVLDLLRNFEQTMSKISSVVFKGGGGRDAKASVETGFKSIERYVREINKILSLKAANQQVEN